jgi:hypothetical protein
VRHSSPTRSALCKIHHADHIQVEKLEMPRLPDTVPLRRITWGPVGSRFAVEKVRSTSPIAVSANTTEFTPGRPTQVPTSSSPMSRSRGCRVSMGVSILNAPRRCEKTRATMRSHDGVEEWRGTRRWTVAATMGFLAVLVSCSAEPSRPAGNGSLAGQVLVSGPLRKATVSVDQLDYGAKSALTIRAHIGDTTTDEDGRFSIDVDAFSGLLLVTAKGGSFVDLATGATVQLDPGTGLESIEPLDLLEERDDALVSPIGHLIATRTRAKMPEIGNIAMAERDAEDHLGRHFGNAPWMRIKLASLAASATSPTEPIRAALVHAALSFLAQDLAQASGASPQEVNVLTLTQQLAADIKEGTFDGNDQNSPVFGEGLQIGVCAPVAGCSAPPAGACAIGACRPLCDLYAGTPRALLAGEVTKVIQSPVINHTGLATGDVLAVARSIADNVDVDLFGSACIEALDRLPPRLDWTAPTPDDGAYVRAAFAARAVANDDTDAHPQVVISDYPNVPADSATSVMINSIGMPDGMLVMTAQAHDMAGNTATIHRTVRVDNTPPAVTLDPTGYVRDDTAWWTADASPTLAGTVSDAAPVRVTTSIPGGTTDATVSGANWSGTLAQPLDLTGADVAVTATDAAGNRTQITQRIRADVMPPQLTFGPSTVRDEATETPTFDGNEAPVHVHTGSPVDLASAAGCPAVTKFSYLLGASAPPYGREVTGQNAPDANPVRYVLVGADDGVGIDASSVQYRVGFRAGGTTTWLINWTSAGTPTNVAPGVDQYTVGIFTDQVPQLATTEGTYDVEFHATDRLHRTATVARCFELHLRAPPLHFQTPGQGAPDLDPIPVDHAYRLLSLALAPGAPFTAIAARLLNATSSGASVLDEDVTNGTGSVVYLDVGVTKPSTVFAGQSFALSHVGTSQSANINCTEHPDTPPPAICEPPDTGPTYQSAPATEIAFTNVSFPARVFELDSNLAPATEVPCLVCGTNDHWKFALPPRAGSTGGSQPPRRFKLMTMVGQVSGLWPTDSNFPATQPFADTALNGISFTGKRAASNQGCTAHSTRTLPDGTTLDTCTRVSTLTPYRALTAVHLRIAGIVTALYATSATQSVPPSNVVTRQSPDNVVWDSSEGTLP